MAETNPPGTLNLYYLVLSTLQLKLMNLFISVLLKLTYFYINLHMYIHRALKVYSF